MALRYQREGYTFHADAQTLAIEPGSKAITLTRWELERLGLIFQDVHPIRFDTEAEKEGVIGGILNSLTDAMARCRGQKDEWMRKNLQRALFLIGGLDEKNVAEILDQEGV